MAITMRAPINLKGCTLWFLDGSSTTVGSTLLVSVPDADFSTCLRNGFTIELPLSQYATLSNNANSAIPAASIAGAKMSVLLVAGGTPALTHTVPPAANIVSAMPGWKYGDTYRLRILTTNANNLTIAADANGTCTITGNAVVAVNTWREWIVTYTAANAVTFQNIGGGNIP
jgi:hypothetical protein